MAIESKPSPPLELRQGGRAQGERAAIDGEKSSNEIYLIERQAIALRRHRWMQVREMAPPAQAKVDGAPASRPDATKRSTLPDNSPMLPFERPHADGRDSAASAGLVDRVLDWLRGTNRGR